jgi:hypothetical protein
MRKIRARAAKKTATAAKKDPPAPVATDTAAPAPVATNTATAAKRAAQGSAKGTDDEGAPGPLLDRAELRAIAESKEHIAAAREDIGDALVEIRGGLDDLGTQLNATAELAGISGELLRKLKEGADALSKERLQIEAEKASLVDRERAAAQAVAERESGYADARAALDRELFERRAEALAQLESDLADLRATRLAEVSEAEGGERKRLRAELASERAEWEETRSRQEHDLKQRNHELERQKGAVSALQSELEGRRAELDDNELELERRSDRINRKAQSRAENLDDEVATRMAEESASFRAHMQSAAAENNRLRETIQSQEDLLGSFERLRRQLGGREPEAVVSELKLQNEQLARQREELATRPTAELRSRFEALDLERRTLANRVGELKTQLQNAEGLAGRSRELILANSNLEASNKALEQNAKIFEAAAAEATSELERLRAAYERPAEVEARYREIELPRIPASDITPTKQGDIIESDWLAGVGAACDSYGLHFNPRILKAFHTALKTAEWSPLTVLAGVSGTGKSELPRLYSHFGGLYFEPLSVQPNWDSQESMLGFFNSIDNRFDAQPVLRFLAQSQKKWVGPTDGDDGYPGLESAVCLVLLDEMNLAHPELYFAEFLSKLELRRGKKGADVPTLPVKVGAGLKAYELPLGRNVLWAGTMNQDETTKSLSDKVLDRSIIIHFPRPNVLKRRQKLAPLDETNRGASLSVKTWRSWMVRESSFTEEEVKPFKDFVETMNGFLAIAGRAIGHRVWQSVEFYMANYPDVRAAGDDAVMKAQAMHVAFEDQLVQKVMPKLRGIDTRGRSKDECLDRIRGQLIAGIGGDGFNLARDFDLAMELGYGQFIWQSASYLELEAADEPA